MLCRVVQAHAVYHTWIWLKFQSGWVPSGAVTACGVEDGGRSCPREMLVSERTLAARGAAGGGSDGFADSYTPMMILLIGYISYYITL